MALLPKPICGIIIGYLLDLPKLLFIDELLQKTHNIRTFTDHKRLYCLRYRIYNGKNFHWTPVKLDTNGVIIEFHISPK